MQTHKAQHQGYGSFLSSPVRAQSGDLYPAQALELLMSEVDKVSHFAI